MTQDTPTDRESVQRLADFLQDEDLHEEAQRHVADTLLALRAALDEAEAENKRLREALKLADLALRGCNMDMGHLLRKVTAALQEKTND